MCAVAHFIEAEGVPTVALSLVRENTVAMRPPRALWVSFPLGRPFGAPDDRGLQSRVLHAALAMFDGATAHGTLEDFPEDAPAMTPEDMEGMVCPVPLPRPRSSASPDPLAPVRTEIALLAPWRALAVERAERSAFGVSTLDLDGILSFLGDMLSGATPTPAPGLSLAQTLRFATEDLRTWVLEAATARPGPRATPTALSDWFWSETAAGTLILDLYPICRASSDADLRGVAERTMIPRRQMHLLRPNA